MRKLLGLLIVAFCLMVATSGAMAQTQYCLDLQWAIQNPAQGPCPLDGYGNPQVMAPWGQCMTQEALDFKLNMDMALCTAGTTLDNYMNTVFQYFQLNYEVCMYNPTYCYEWLQTAGWWWLP